MQLQSNQEHIQKKVLYAMAVYGDEEKQAVLDSMNNRWLAAGPKVKEFENEIAKLFGKKYGIATNSGSSANLLSLKALDFPHGSEVITPACTFSTTVSSIILNNLVPVFVDVLVGRYTINEDLVEAAINKRTKAILVPQLIGGVCDMEKLRAIADKHGLILIDDSCDTLAPKIGERTAASWSDLTTTSFYGSHIITALGMGGMVLTDDEELKNKIVTLRDWGRVGDDREDFESRFNFNVDGIPYDSKFLYGELGFNLKMNEAAAAFGLEQLKRLDGFLDARHKNHKFLTDYFKKYEQWFHVPYTLFDSDTNWLAYALTIKKDAPFSRYEFLKHMDKDNGIQTRVLFSGNITRHPFYKDHPVKIVGTLDNSDLIMANGLLLGCHQGMNQDELDYIVATAEAFFARFL
jgi:CDP-4-dehydro-6-deoxyglucose reductase, E1